MALLEDKKLVELHYERGQGQFAVGDIYLGKIKKLILCLVVKRGNVIR